MRYQINKLVQKNRKVPFYTAIAVNKLPVALLLLLKVLSKRGLFGLGGSDKEAERWSFWKEKKNVYVS